MPDGKRFGARRKAPLARYSGIWRVWRSASAKSNNRCWLLPISTRRGRVSGTFIRVSPAIRDIDPWVAPSGVSLRNPLNSTSVIIILSASTQDDLRAKALKFGAAVPKTLMVFLQRLPLEGEPANRHLYSKALTGSCAAKRARSFPRALGQRREP